MTQPINFTLIQGQKTAAQEVFAIPDLLSQIFNRSQERALSQVNKATREESQMLTNSSWQEIRRAATANHPEGPTIFQKRHPTLSYFIRSNQIENYRQLVDHLKREAQDLGLTQTEQFQAFRTSTAAKYLLFLDALIEKNNFDRANRYNYLWDQLGDTELPDIRNYETWNEAIRPINIMNIKKLDFNNCNLTRIPQGIFKLQNLNHLNLYKNKISALSPQISLLQYLETLSLGNNQITALPKEIGLLQHLHSLDLDSNQIATLPQEIGQLINLQRLTIRSNKLTTLPPQILYLQELKILNLNSNQIAALPKEIGELQDLQSLDLQNNQLAELPEEIRLLQKLRMLNLSKNLIVALPDKFLQLQNLSGLCLDHNKLTSLPKEFGQLNLRFVRIGKNPLTELPESFERFLPNFRDYRDEDDRLDGHLTKEDVKKLINIGKARRHDRLELKK